MIPSHVRVTDTTDAALWELYRSVRSSYQQICLLLVERGIIAEMPKDLDKPVKV